MTRLWSSILRIIILVALLVLPGWHAEAAGSSTHYDRAMIYLTASKTPYMRWCYLGPAAKESFNVGKFAQAKAFAEELERLIPKYQGDWNYGSAVQDSNLVLGRLALKAGHAEVARKRLLAAGRSPGSAQMDSFGPNMTLADDLLKKGEKTVVLEYFALCKKFWMRRFSKLGTWEKDVKAGRTPDFGANLLY